MFSFGLTWGAYNWILEGGILKIFLVIASIQVIICLLSVPMCESPLFFVSDHCRERWANPYNYRHLWQKEPINHAPTQPSQVDAAFVNNTKHLQRCIYSFSVGSDRDRIRDWSGDWGYKGFPTGQSYDLIT